MLIPRLFFFVYFEATSIKMLRIIRWHYLVRFWPVLATPTHTVLVSPTLLYEFPIGNQVDGLLLVANDVWVGDL